MCQLHHHLNHHHICQLNHNQQLGATPHMSTRPTPTIWNNVTCVNTTTTSTWHTITCVTLIISDVTSACGSFNDLTINGTSKKQARKSKKKTLHLPSLLRVHWLRTEQQAAIVHKRCPNETHTDTHTQNTTQEEQALGVLLDKMADNDHIKLDSIEIRVYVSLLDLPYSRHKVVENQKNTEWPQEITWSIRLHKYPVYTEYSSLMPKFHSFRSTDSHFQDRRLSKIGNATNDHRLTLTT